jgi:hypothetical protein
MNDAGFISLNKAVELKPYKARPFKSYELMSLEEIVAGAGGYLIVDTESYNNYFLIAFKDIKTKKRIIFEPPFDPKLLSWILHSYTTIGFNSIKYDLPLIWLSYFTQDVEVIKEASNDLISGIFYNEFKGKYNCQVFPTKHVDLIEVCPLRGSLKLYAGRLHAERIQDVPFNPYGDLTPEQIEIVKDYCVNSDLDATELLLDNLKEQLQLRQQLTIEYKQNVMSKSDAQIAETVIGSELKRISGHWPKKPKDFEQRFFNFQVPSNMFFQTDYMKNVLQLIANSKFSINDFGRLERSEEISNLKIKIADGIYRMGIGGLHSSEECIAWKSNDEYQIYDRDVASFYPEIIRKLKLFPKHLGEDFLKVFDGIVERRLTAKKAKRIAESENLKVTINGTFGKTGSPHSFLYAPEMTIQITVGGQLYLLMLIEQLELRGIKVISANTDGVMIYCRKDQVEPYLAVIASWEKITGFTTEETKYQAIYSRDVNAYIAVKNESEVKGKNTLYDPWRSKNAKDAYWRFQKNPTMQICVEAVEMLLTKDISIEKTIGECKDITKFVSVRNVKGGAHKDGYYLGKTIRYYYAKNCIGAIHYISNSNRVPDTDGALPCMDLPTEFPNDIDYKRYIDKTIELLYEIGFLKKQQHQMLF